MAITQETVGTSATTLYTSSGLNAITVIYLLNDHSSAVTVQIHIVQASESAASTNKIIKDLVIPIGETFVLDTDRPILGNGDSVQATADVGSVVHATLSYIGV